MKWIVQKPSLYDFRFLDELVEIINSGDEVNTNLARLLDADHIAVALDGEKVTCTATLKNPNDNYKKDVFTSAGMAELAAEYARELGYIVTIKEYEGQKLCQKTIELMMPVMQPHNVFATTRKPSMAHILSKFQFTQTGSVYKEDLSLFCLVASSPRNFL